MSSVLKLSYWFDRLCRWAAIGFLVLLTIWAFQILLAYTGRTSFAIGSAGGRCAFDKSILVCSGFPGAPWLSYLFIMPPAVFIGAPLVLLGALNGALRLEKASAEMVQFGFVACSWFVLGVVGVLIKFRRLVEKSLTSYR